MAVILLGGAPYEPTGYSPSAWYKINAQTGYNDNDTLTTIVDSSGNGYTLNVVSGTPKYRTNVVNGYPTIRSANNGDIKRQNVGSGTFISTSAHTVMTVMRCTTFAAGKYAYMHVQEGVTQNTDVVLAAGPLWRVEGVSAGIQTVDKTETDGSWIVHTNLHSGGNLYNGLSDTRTASMASVACGNITLNANDDIILLGSGTGAAGLTGDIAEQIWFTTALTEAQRQEWERWFGYKYAITLPY